MGNECSRRVFRPGKSPCTPCKEVVFQGKIPMCICSLSCAPILMTCFISFLALLVIYNKGKRVSNSNAIVQLYSTIGS